MTHDLFKMMIGNFIEALLRSGIYIAQKAVLTPFHGFTAFVIIGYD
jgi:hypothetical protein